ncbi:hypothetical protein SPLC1_S230660 [Arthrospira platensis C1]|nr:hypothetical protein SPLC1_S230660 [Arthrospira platensis C1]
MAAGLLVGFPFFKTSTITRHSIIPIIRDRLFKTHTMLSFVNKN